MLEMTHVHTIITLVTQGLICKEVAARLNNTASTICRWLDRLNLTDDDGRLARNPDNTVTVFPPMATPGKKNRSSTRLTAYERGYTKYTSPGANRLIAFEGVNGV